MEKQLQVCDIRPGKGMTIAQSNEHLRNGQENAFLKKVSGTMDPSRTNLNFEIGKGGVVKEVDRKYSITRRIQDNLKARGIVDPNLGMPNDAPGRRNTVANIILQGSRERMRELAFGDQEVNYERGADNSHITRNVAIEQWAIDMYNFMAKKYGEQNIAAFVVHLDETNPHIHCTLLPITERNKFSYNYFFGGYKGDKENGKRKFLQLHDELAEVNKKYGLARGESVARTGAQHKSYLQWLKEQVSEKKETLEEQKQLLDDLDKEVKKAQTRLKGLQTMLSNLEKREMDIQAEIEYLENENINAEVTNDEYTAQMRKLQTELQLVEEKIIARKTQLRNAEDELQKVADKKWRIKKSYEEMEKQLYRDFPKFKEQTLPKMEAVGWRLAAEEATQRAQQIEDFRDSLSDEDKENFDSWYKGSLFEVLVNKADAVAELATSLFLGYMDGVLLAQGSSGGGGGGGESSGWGRKRDEDDFEFGKRCFRGAIFVLDPERRTKKTQKEERPRRGFRR